MNPQPELFPSAPTLPRAAELSENGFQDGPVSSIMRDSEEVLQQNYLRFQKSLLQSVDRQVVQIQAKLSENEVVLKRTVDERDHIGASLYKAQLEVDRANERIERTNAVAKHFEDELHVIAGEKEASERVVKELEKKNKASHNWALLEEVEKLKERLGETVTKSSQLTDINTAYHSDIKIHRRIEEKLKKELEYVDERRREAKSDLEDQRKMCEKLQQRNAEIELILEAQKHETAMATQAVAKMHIEISHLTNEKNLMQKQWEDAMTAMGKRDETFQAVTGQKEKVLEQLLDLSNMNRALKLDKEDAEKKLANADLEKKALENQVQFLRSNLFVLENKNRDSRSAIVEAQVAESLYKQELERVSKYHKLTKDELERKSSSISELKCKLDSLKQSFDEKIRNETIVQVARKEEAVIAQALSEVSQVKKEEEGKNIDLRHENAELRLTVRKLQDNLAVITLDKQKLQHLFDDVIKHYGSLYEEAKHWLYDLERKEHDINYMRATIQELTEVDKTRPFQMAIAKLQKELAAAKAENDNIQNMWLDAQKENLKCKNDIARFRDDNMFLRTQLGITDTVKIKTAKEIQEAKEKSFEQKMENAKLYSELRKLQPLVDEYRQKMLDLEQQLLEAKVHIQKEHVHGHTEKTMLSTELRRLYEDRKEVSRARMLDERSAQAQERKFILAKEMIEKLKADRADLQKKCFDYKTRAEDMERRYFDAQMQAKNLAEKAGKTVGEITSRLCGNGKPLLTDSDGTKLPSPRNVVSLVPIKLPPPVWASLATTPRSKSVASSEPLPTEITDENPASSSPVPVSNTDELPDFESWRLKIVSLTSERTFLVNENTILKGKVEELNSTIARMERAASDTHMTLRANEKQLRAAIEDHKFAMARFQRAQKVAAVIEQQFKEAKPNTRINYSYSNEAEPSTQLIAALMVRGHDFCELHDADKSLQSTVGGDLLSQKLKGIPSPLPESDKGGSDTKVRKPAGRKKAPGTGTRELIKNP